MDSKRRLTKTLVVLIAVALAATASLAFAKSNRLTGTVKNDPPSKLGMTVVFRDGKPKILKDIDVKISYGCDHGGVGVLPETVVKAHLPLKIKMFQINGHPSFRKFGYKFEGKTWDIAGNANNRGTKIVGGISVKGTNSAGEECQNAAGTSNSAEFTVRK